MQYICNYTNVYIYIDVFVYVHMVFSIHVNTTKGFLEVPTKSWP